MLKIKNYSKLISILLCFLFAGFVHAAQTSIVNFSFTEPGVYRVTYQHLFDVGIDLQGVKHKKLALTYGDEPVPVHTEGQTTGKNKFFGPGASITFVVPEVEITQYTDDTVYTLHVINKRNKKLRKTIKRQGGKVRASLVSQEHYQAEYNFEQQNSYFLNTGSTDDPWVMGPLFAFGAPGTQTYNFDLDGFDPSQGDVTASFVLSGGTDLPEAPDHHAQLKVNNLLIDDQEFDGFEAVELSGILSGNQLTGVNDSIEVNLPYDLGLPFDFVILDKFSIQYPRKLMAIDNRLLFESENKQYRVSGFDDEVVVYQVAPDGSVIELTKGTAFVDENNKHGLEFSEHVNKKTRKNSVYIMKFSEYIENYRNHGDGLSFSQFVKKFRKQLNKEAKSQNLAKQFFAVTENSYLQAGISTTITEENISSGSAEYLVIAHSDFYGEALDRLVQLRQGKYSVKVVNVEQIYAQFGAHVSNPEVIKDYIKFAVNNLSTRMVVLVGGDTYDYKNYISNSVSFIPTLYVPVENGKVFINFTPSDASYGDLDDDGIPDIPIGRLPVRTAAEMALVVDKIEDYENRANLGVASYDRKSIFVADHLDNGTGYSFTNDADALIDFMPQSWKDNITDAEKAYLEQDGGTQAKTELIDAINSGVSLVSFVGHSNHLQWSFSNPVLFNTTDAQNLLNTDKPSVFTQWGCWNTYYVLPDGNALGQILMLNGSNGAATVLGASTLTQADTERGLANFLYQKMFEPGKPLGEAVIEAKQAYSTINPSAEDVFLGWQILGDPAIEMEPAL